ncbi:MAG: DUF92 domain-containing protein, partial [Anaerolineaceae bacterium]|nr:DUF92 domain-containing protein [Anaerolineaceae bacterium]
AAAAMLGTVIFGLGGLGWAILLLAFFISSSVLSRLFRKRKRALDEKFSKGSRRDAGQVAANGGIAGLFVLLHVFLPAAGWVENTGWAWAAFAAALAAANADTWATELGVLSRSVPRLITSGEIVEPGTSGGVTLFGSLAALSASALIALLAIFFWQGQISTNSTGFPGAYLAVHEQLAWFGILTIAGFSGSLFDSFLGATLQAIYYCPACSKETERHPYHICGSTTRRIRGLSWLDNDWVNTGCTLVGALVALVGYLLLGH